ncbi:MAG: RagB/SusD family nutrient uptake outer membrane protein [Bacteroidales bacterium]|nr:RagB/SusD family nutrient uptake outer membrane protein [Bacteroidales bacterium]
MKKIFYSKTVSILAVIVLSFACADLDLPSDGRLTFRDIFANYAMTRNFYGTCRAYIPQYGLVYSDNTPLASYSDEAHDAGDNRSGTGVNDWYNNRTSPFGNPLAYSIDWWGHLFQGIRKCNVFLASVNDPELATAVISEEEKNGWIAEVQVVRAFYYLQLIKRYGGVPLIDTPYEVTHDFSQDRRASFEDCVDFIIADCDAALAIPEPSSPTIGFRWDIADTDRGKLTRGFAWAIKSQTALYAASPLWYSAGSKYTWEYAAAITKEALDQCLAHGYELYSVPVGEDVAQNPYAYYFIQQSDPSRSVDKETIYETTAARTNVWRYAGTPVTDGMSKAGAGPSQELVDCYEMAATGEMPVLGYSDADHLQPIVNTASGYDPANPYEGRDPRFYASIYYNGAPRSLSGSIQKDIFPLEMSDKPEAPKGLDVTDHGDYIDYTSNNGDPYFYTTPLTRPLTGGAVKAFTFEYKSNRALGNGQFFWCIIGPEEVNSSTGIQIPQASEWTKFEYNIPSNSEFGTDGTRKDPATHYIRLDLGTSAGYEISIRNMQIEVYTPPPPPTPVETFVGGNCGISDRVTDTRFTRTGYYLRKFNNYRSNINVDADGLMKVFRLGELYMNFAEAAYQAYGADVPVTSAVAGAMTAREAVNAVRARAAMPPLPSGLSRADFEKRYRNERRVEFAFEEHRFFDVRRWKILNETDNFVTGMRITQSGGNYTYTRFKLAERHTNSDKYLLFPLSQNEAAKMEDETGVNWQNPGWY